MRFFWCAGFFVFAALWAYGLKTQPFDFASICMGLVVVMWAWGTIVTWRRESR